MAVSLLNARPREPVATSVENRLACPTTRLVEFSSRP